jgi:hypothetical protein
MPLWLTDCTPQGKLKTVLLCSRPPSQDPRPLFPDCLVKAAGFRYIVYAQTAQKPCFPKRKKLGHSVPGGYKYGDLALKVGGVSDETVKYGLSSAGLRPKSDYSGKA